MAKVGASATIKKKETVPAQQTVPVGISMAAPTVTATVGPVQTYTPPSGNGMPVARATAGPVSTTGSTPEEIQNARAMALQDLQQRVLGKAQAAADYQMDKLNKGFSVGQADYRNQYTDFNKQAERASTKDLLSWLADYKAYRDSGSWDETQRYSLASRFPVISSNFEKYGNEDADNSYLKYTGYDTPASLLDTMTAANKTLEGPQILKDVYSTEEYRQNPFSYFPNWQSMSDTLFNQGASLDTYGYDRNDFITVQEAQNYEWLYENKGEKAAEEYRKSLNNKNDTSYASWIEGVYNPIYASEHPVAASVTSALGTYGAPLAFLENTLATAKGEAINPNSWANTLANQRTQLREEVGKNITSNAGRFLYNTGMSMADNLALMPLNALGGVGELAMLGTLGASAANDRTRELMNQGASSQEAYMRGLVSGAIEGITEKIGLDNLLKTAWKGGAGSIIKNIAKQAAAEGMEEGVSNVMNLAADTIASVVKQEGVGPLEQEVQALEKKGLSRQQATSQVILGHLKDLGMDIAGGALSGAVMGGGATAVNYNSLVNQGANFTTNEDGTVNMEAVQALIERGNNMPADTISHRQADLLQQKINEGKAVTAREASILYANNVSAESTMPYEELLKLRKAEADQTEWQDAKDEAMEHADELNKGVRQLYEKVVEEAVTNGATGKQAIAEFDRAYTSGFNKMGTPVTEHLSADTVQNIMQAAQSERKGTAATAPKVAASVSNAEQALDRFNNYEENGAKVYQTAVREAVENGATPEEARVAFNQVYSNVRNNTPIARGTNIPLSASTVADIRNAALKDRFTAENKAKADAIPTSTNAGVSVSDPQIRQHIEQGRLTDTISFMDDMGKRFGVEISPVAKLPQNGQINLSTGHIDIALDTAFGGIINRDQAMRATLGHEISHRMRQVSPKTWDKFTQAVIGADIDQFNADVNKMINETYKGDITRDAAQEEVIADYIGNRFFSGDIDTLRNMVESIDSLPQRSGFIQHIVDMASWLKSKLTGQPANNAARIETEFKKMFKETQARVQQAEEQRASEEEIKYSKKDTGKDSEGRTLTAEQTEFFAESKARDEDGNLLVLYHGTDAAGFNTFRGSVWMTTSRKDAGSYGAAARTYDPNEQRVDVSTKGGDFTIGNNLRFDTEQDRDEFLKNYPDAVNYMTPREMLAAKGAAEIEDDYDRYDELVEQEKRDKQIRRAYRKYEDQHSEVITLKELIDNKEQYTVDDFKDAFLSIDREAYFDDEYDNFETDEEFRDALAEALEESFINGDEGYDDFPVRVRIPAGKTSTAADVTHIHNRIYEMYANVTHPYTYDAKGRGSEGNGAYYNAVQTAMDSDEYDGAIINNIRVGRYQELGTVVVAKDSSQTKLVSNATPTQNPDIRYSKRPNSNKSAVIRQQRATIDRLRHEMTLTHGVEPDAKAVAKAAVNLANEWQTTMPKAEIKAAFADIAQEYAKYRRLTKYHSAAKYIRNSEQRFAAKCDDLANKVAESADGIAVETIKNDIMQAVFEAPVSKPTAADKLKQQTAEPYEKRLTKAVEPYEKRLTRARESKERTRLLNLMKRLDKLAKKSNSQTRAVIKDAIGEFDLVAKGITKRTEMKLAGLEDWVREHTNDPDAIITPQILKKIDRIHKKHLSELTIEDVQAATRSLIELETNIWNENHVVGRDEKRTTAEIGEQAIKGVQKAQGVGSSALARGMDKFLINGLMRPETEILRIVGFDKTNPLYDYMFGDENSILTGQKDSQDYQRQAHENYFRKFLDDKAFMETVTGKKARAIEITGIDKDSGQPRTVKVTPDFLMAMYMHSRNVQNLMHICEYPDENGVIREPGGMKVPDYDLYRKGKKTEAYNKGVRLKFTRSQFENQLKGLSEKEMEFIHAAQRYYSEFSKPRINNVSEQLIGYALADVDNYFRIQTDSDFRGGEFEALKFDGSLEGMGWTKERTNSAMPIRLIPLSEQLQKDIVDHSKYVGLAIPIRNFAKIYGITEHTYKKNDKGEWKLQTPFASSVISEINRKHPSGADTDYIRDLLVDLQNPVSNMTALDKIFAELRSRYAGSVLLFNLGVGMKQAASFWTAAAEVGWKPIMKALPQFGKAMAGIVKPVNKKTLDTISKYSPLMRLRTEGMSTQELADMQRLNHKVPAALNWIQNVDVNTVAALWKAAEYYVRDNFKDLKVGSEEYYRKVGDVHTRIITKTQPNYSELQRPGLLRSKSEITKTLMMFKTQPFQNFNILYEAVGAYKAAERNYSKDASAENKATRDEARKRLAWAISSQVVSNGVFAAMQVAWDLLRRKEDPLEEDKATERLNSWFKNMMSSWAGMVPGGTQGLEVVQKWVDDALVAMGKEKYFDSKAYGFELDASIEGLNKLVDLITNLPELGGDIFGLIKGDEDKEEHIRDLFKQFKDISSFLGIPTTNLMNLTQATMEWAMTMGLKYNDAQAKYLAERFINGVDNQHPRKHYAELAIAAGEDVMQMYREDSAFDSTTQTASEYLDYVIREQKKDAFEKEYGDKTRELYTEERFLPGSANDAAFREFVAKYMETADGTRSQAEVIDALAATNLSESEREAIYNLYGYSDNYKKAVDANKLAGEKAAFEEEYGEGTKEIYVAGADSVRDAAFREFVNKYMENSDGDKSQAEIVEALNATGLPEEEKEAIYDLYGYSDNFKKAVDANEKAKDKADFAEIYGEDVKELFTTDRDAVTEEAFQQFVDKYAATNDGNKKRTKDEVMGALAASDLTEEEKKAIYYMYYSPNTSYDKEAKKYAESVGAVSEAPVASTAETPTEQGGVLTSLMTPGVNALSPGKTSKSAVEITTPHEIWMSVPDEMQEAYKAFADSYTAKSDGNGKLSQSEAIHALNDVGEENREALYNLLADGKWTSSYHDAKVTVEKDDMKQTYGTNEMYLEDSPLTGDRLDEFNRAYAAVSNNNDSVTQAELAAALNAMGVSLEEGEAIWASYSQAHADKYGSGWKKTYANYYSGGGSSGGGGGSRKSSGGSSGGGGGRSSGGGSVQPAVGPYPGYSSTPVTQPVAMPTTTTSAPQDAYTGLQTHSNGGNVDLTFRPVLKAVELRRKGWGNVLSDTVRNFVKSYFGNGKALNFTPIVVDEDGKYVRTLSPNELREYAEAVLKGEREDDLKLQVGTAYEGADALAQAEKAAAEIQKLDEEYTKIA